MVVLPSRYNAILRYPILNTLRMLCQPCQPNVSAIVRAMNVIKTIGKENEEIDWKSMYSTPHMTVPSEQTLADWQVAIDAGNIIVCAHEVLHWCQLYCVRVQLTALVIVMVM